MKEFGSEEAKQAYLLCTNGHCGFNHVDPDKMPVNQAIALGKVHDELESHEAVIAKFDSEHPLTVEQKVSILANTGIHLG